MSQQQLEEIFSRWRDNTWSGLNVGTVNTSDGGLDTSKLTNGLHDDFDPHMTVMSPGVHPSNSHYSNSQSSMSPARRSARIPTVDAPEDPFTNMAHSIPDRDPPRHEHSDHEPSDHEPSDNESQNVLAPSPTYSEYRRANESIATLHRFSGTMNGKRPVYFPVYKRDEFGRLMKLKKTEAGSWKYVVHERLSEFEIDAGLTAIAEPGSAVDSQRSESKRVVIRHSLADLLGL